MFDSIMTKLPELKTDEYFKFMESFISELEKVLPIKVYGFTYYSTLGYYWITPNVDINDNFIVDGTPNQIPFSTAYKLVYGMKW